MNSELNKVYTKRNENESFQDYRKRLKDDKDYIKFLKKGIPVFISKRYTVDKDTGIIIWSKGESYVKAKHGPLTV